jgi:hypothetical protein
MSGYEYVPNYPMPDEFQPRNEEERLGEERERMVAGGGLPEVEPAPAKEAAPNSQLEAYRQREEDRYWRHLREDDALDHWE